MAKSHIEKVLAVFHGISAGDADRATRHIHPERFIQHNPYAVDGVEGLKEFIRQSPREQLHLTVVRAFQDGPLCFHPGEGTEIRPKHLF